LVEKREEGLPQAVDALRRRSPRKKNAVFFAEDRARDASSLSTKEPKSGGYAAKIKMVRRKR